MIDIEESNRLLIKEENDTELPDDDMTESNEDSSNTSDEQTLNCDQCDKEFENRAQFIKHRRVHRKKQCPVCFKSISVNNFKAHVAAHKGSFSCDVCAKSFASKHSLNEHKNVIHGLKQSNDQKLQCDQCEKVCASKTQLTNHLRIHNVKQCPVCYKSVPIPSFKRHVAVHSGAFLCDVCSKSFTRKKTLDEHKLIKHGSTVVNDGKLKCDQCDKVCVTKVQLMNHQRVHQLKKCPICSKSIPVNNLPVHVKAHTPCFSCDICDKSFTRKSSLNDHKKTQHATNIPESHKLHCDVCEKVK
ncbi:zinc finger protein 808-like [Anopheles nili]|uniref:zinc finger protein 808-like n=1 Tax=Anopheles nili TaxID=185578 RepID=UPI00237B54ED|nr:zinc finger protein 808-like [Anopheles nili]